jgi:hypothetical protein
MSNLHRCTCGHFNHDHRAFTRDPEREFTGPCAGRPSGYPDRPSVCECKAFVLDPEWDELVATNQALASGGRHAVR